MGSGSERMLEIKEEYADQWIRERLEDEDADEESEEYQELANQFSDLQDHLAEVAEFRAELQWLKENGSSTVHKNFIEELEELKKLKEKTSGARAYLIYRMTYAYAVTLLEAFLGDTAKSLVSENELFFTNSLQIPELKKVKYSLDYLSTNGVDARGLAIRELSNILYHNIPKAKRIFETILGTSINIDISALVKIMEVRHDIVHRNGKTKEDKSIYINNKHILEMITHIEEFSKELQALINEKT